jgi:hypothetical protein
MVLEQNPEVEQEVLPPDEEVEAPIDEQEASDAETGTLIKDDIDEDIDSRVNAIVDSKVAEAVAVERQKQSGYQKRINILEDQLKAAERRADDAEARLKQRDDEDDKRLFDTLGDDPAASAIKAAQERLRRQRDEADARDRKRADEERDNATVIEAGRRYLKLADAQAIEDEFNLPAGTISKQVDRLGDKEAMRVHAQMLIDAGVGKPSQQPRPGVATTRPLDTATGAPLGRKSFEQIEQDFSTGKVSREEYEKARQQRGL